MLPSCTRIIYVTQNTIALGGSKCSTLKQFFIGLCQRPKNTGLKLANLEDYHLLNRTTRAGAHYNIHLLLHCSAIKHNMFKASTKHEIRFTQNNRPVKYPITQINCLLNSNFKKPSNRHVSDSSYSPKNFLKRHILYESWRR